MSLFIFDKDGTLVNGQLPGKNGKTRPANTPEEQVLLPNVYDKIQELRKKGHFITVASNQGGMAWGLMTWGDVEALMQDLSDKLGGLDYWVFSPYDPRAAIKYRCTEGDDGRPYNLYAQDSEMRKPNPGMYQYLMNELGFLANNVVVVGDQETDRIPAEAIGAAFVWAKDFFEW